MRDFARWLQREIYRLAGGGTITLPAGRHYLASPIHVSAGMGGISIVGDGTEIVALESVGLGPMLTVEGDDITLTGLTWDARACAATRAVLFNACAGVEASECTFLGGLTCVEFRASTGLVLSDLIVGAASDLGPGLGRGLYITNGANDIAVDGVRAFDDQLRHLVCLEDNVEDAALLDVATEIAHTFAAVDLHGKLEGNAGVGSITLNGCAGRVNVGNPDHTDGSHLTLLSHNAQGKNVIVYPNSVLRYENLTNGTILDQSGGTATITNMGEPE